MKNYLERMKSNMGSKELQGKYHKLPGKYKELQGLESWK